jgi:hypothetical protein
MRRFKSQIHVHTAGSLFFGNAPPIIRTGHENRLWVR